MARRGAVLGGLVGLLAGCVLVPVSGAPQVSAATTYTWEPARTDGGGFVTMVEPSPTEAGVWLAASDVAGVFRSTDGGMTWQPPATGFEAPDTSAVASIAFDRLTAGRVYACAGQTRPDGALTGAFLRSADGGRSWVVATGAVACNGSNSQGSASPQPHPRSVGRLIVPDATTPGKVWVGTYRSGVKVSTDAGATWTDKGLGGAFIRALLADPDDPSVLFAAVRTESGTGGGVYRTTNANAVAPKWKKIAGAPMAEELAIVGRTLYVAAGTKGLYRADLSAATPTLVRLNTLQAFVGAATDVTEVVASRAGGVDVLLVGLDQDAKCTGGFCPTVLRSGDGGATWAALPASPAGIRPNVGGGGPLWRQTVWPDTLLGGTSHVVSAIRADPFAPQRLLVGGRAGIWQSIDGGTAWFPSVQGLAMTFHLSLAADPVTPGRVLSGVTDWDLMATNDGGRTLTDVNLPAEATAVAPLSGWAGPGPLPFYVGISGAAGQGDVLQLEQPLGPFVPLGLGAASGTSGVLGVGARDVAGQRVVIALTVERGLWRKHGAGPWTKVAASPGGGNASPFPRFGQVVWAPDGGAVFVTDRSTESGAWRSLDAGATWQKVVDGLVDVAVDPTAPERLWIAGNGAVRRVDQARQGSVATGGLTVSATTPLPRARLVDVGPAGEVVVVTEDDSVLQPGVVVARPSIRRSSDAGRTWTEIGGAAFSAGVVDPVALSVGPDGVLQVGTHGNGWWVGRA